MARAQRVEFVFDQRSLEAVERLTDREMVEITLRSPQSGNERVILIPARRRREDRRGTLILRPDAARRRGELA